MKPVEIAVGIIRDVITNRIFITQRPTTSFLAGYWEFPGGKIEIGETPVKAVIRELYEEVGIRATTPILFKEIAHDYPGKRLIFYFFIIEKWYGEPYGREGQPGQWVTIEELECHNFPEANRSIIKMLKQKWAIM